VGPSGSGKSTLAKIIAGALLPTAGTVRIDHAQRSDWDPDFIGRYVGYLPQETSLLEGTIKDNVSRFARWEGRDPGELDSATVSATKAAGVHEMILQLPQGYDTVLGPMGAGVSAGQAQRIALARALFGEPSLLVLDEPNAFLDAEGEAALLKAIAAARSRGATVVIIAHGQSVLRGADRLLVLEGGQQRMLGSAAEVVARLRGTRSVEAVA
jgi:ATP-binding cassette subfamily C protein